MRGKGYNSAKGVAARLPRAGVTGRLTLMLAALVGGAAHAQVFPQIEKEEVRKQIQRAPAPVETPEPAVAPLPQESEIDGAKVLARYNELLAAYKRDEKQLRAGISGQVSAMHVSVRDYIEGVALLRLGAYREAERKLSSVRASVKKEEEAANDGLRQVIGEIKSGAAYQDRMIAAAMQHWDEFKTEDVLGTNWERARRDGEKVINEFKRLNLEDGAERISRMQAWLINAPHFWRKTWQARIDAAKQPQDPANWKRLAGVTGVPDQAADDFTPMYLVQRAALTVLREFWPNDEYVGNGQADVAIAFNHLALLQLDGWESLLKPQGYHSETGRTTLAAGMQLAENYVKLIDSLRAPK